MGLIMQKRVESLIRGLYGDEATKAVRAKDFTFDVVKAIPNSSMLSCIPSKYFDAYRKELIEVSNPKECTVRKQHGFEMKGGKFLVKLFPDATHKEIHEFLSKLEGGKIEVVKGEDIRYWYHYENYARNESTDTLGASCMKHDKCQPYFDIYVNNPDVCSLAILKNDEDKLIGRALLWKAEDSNGNKHLVMDRIYGTAKTAQKFIAWAEKNGYWHKQSQTYSDYTLLREGYASMDAKDLNISGDFKASEYPYMDTFDKLNQSKTALTNRDGYYQIKSTGGGIS